jgi:hypothetical protein
VGHVRHDIREFVDAVLALSDDPGPANLERYLAVSRELEESRRPQPSAAQEVLGPRDRATAGDQAAQKRRRQTHDPAYTHLHSKENAP